MFPPDINTIQSKLSELEDACEEIADTVSDYLHFTRPEKGPLRYYEDWMPHMIQGLAKGIRDNRWLLTDQIEALAGDMSVAIDKPDVTADRPVIVKNYNQTILDGKILAESVNEQLGVIL